MSTGTSQRLNVKNSEMGWLASLILEFTGTVIGDKFWLKINQAKSSNLSFSVPQSDDLRWLINFEVIFGPLQNYRMGSKGDTERA